MTAFFVLLNFTMGEIKIPVTFEDDTGRELPSPSLLFRPLRQMLYALLFNQHHLQYLAEQKKEKEGIEEKVPDIVIKEWVWSKSNKYNKPDCVPSMPLGWPVPTVTRLWFGSGPDDNKKRLQAFLTCMRSNNPIMCDPLYVPQHFIILCCVLRWVIVKWNHILKVFSIYTTMINRMYDLNRFLKFLVFFLRNN
ncbi:UNVERIFIED_CONTAM: Constitutive coactivator of PPAR-gamma-like protein 1 [Trichonephila clavipes]